MLLSPSGSYLTQRYLQSPAPRAPSSARKPFSQLKLNAVRNKRFCRFMYSEVFSSEMGKWNHGVSQLNGATNLHYPQMKNRGAFCSASEEQNSSTDVNRKRKVIEHICLLKAREGLSDAEEKDMLDYLYTSQYQMGGIVAISLGRISDQNLENYTHAVYMRFQKKDDLAKFYDNPFYLRVLRDHVMPYCHVCPDMGYFIWIMNLK